MLLLHLLDTRGQQSATIRFSLPTSYPETLSSLFTLLCAALVQLTAAEAQELSHMRHLQGGPVFLRSQKVLCTSDGASTVVPGDPSQCDGGGGGGGDSQTGLVRRNWMIHTQTAT